ncbi:AAA family ATPase [Stenotrophomonas rhizophila]|uniref:AAA family ATPase n=1 Tax=Stenotrophomonas TaxID=40323 RepID=UPI003B7AEFD0
MAALTLLDMERQDLEQETCLTVSPPSTETVTRVFPKPVMVDAAGLLTANFPRREQLLAPWLLSQSLSMIYAPRGIGKTHVALGISYALASGGEFLSWRAPHPVKVAYLDGEMPGADLRNRVQAIADSAGKAVIPHFLQFMTPDLQPNGMMPNLYDREGQNIIVEAVGDAQVIIVDNISALVRGGKENEGESWQPVAEWALRMRASGRSVVFIHHAGKGGQQRGTSKREDLLDTVIALRRPGDYTPDEGARFEVHFEKARALYGEDVAPLEATLITKNDGRQEWALRTAADGLDDSLVEMMSLGLSQSEAAKELNVGRSTVIRHLKRLQEEGRYQPKQKNVGGRPRLNPVRSGSCPRCDGEGCGNCNG